MNLSIWGGVECTVNRVGDRFHDQLERTGHAARADDLDRIADLGIRTLRYPVLWERIERAPGRYDFDWTDERMARLYAHGIEPIVGLVHHGSGPAWTHLHADEFVTGLARFAAVVAARYPWVTSFTPINEPLTTARFSGLYGHWYPHHRSDRGFARALSVELEATRAAMAAIRRVTPKARLVQTEDFGTVRGTPRIAYQAEFENHRRFLSLDWLAGKVGAHHPLFAWLIERAGVPRDVLASWVDDPCLPDVVGLNYYLTSDRFLDERVDLYPPHRHGHNGRHAYADVETVRVTDETITGHRLALETAYRRYHRPVALTEVHLGCTVDEQIRWLVEAWHGAKAARATGTPVEAITAWSLFGSCDWDSLVTEARGHYEPGAFDVRDGVAHPTALAEVIRELATTGTTTHVATREPGWWRRPERWLHPAYDEVAQRAG